MHSALPLRGGKLGGNPRAGKKGAICKRITEIGFEHFSNLFLFVCPTQVTRVLLERLIVNRPHPWGLLITFIELIKNPQFQFWQHEFVTCAPEIQKLFESVAR